MQGICDALEKQRLPSGVAVPRVDVRVVRVGVRLGGIHAQLVLALMVLVVDVTVRVDHPLVLVHVLVPSGELQPDPGAQAGLER
jgi:hypothetical protein